MAALSRFSKPGATARVQDAPDPSHREPAMQAIGTFDITPKPQQPDNPDAVAGGAMRLALDKRFHGDLDGESHGEMLAAGDGRSAGAYVAIEKFDGRLHGRAGSFALVHRALMRDGREDGWTVVVVPGTGTGALAGIDGEMRIAIADGKHQVTFDYSLPDG
jgi:hypothetical protein